MCGNNRRLARRPFLTPRPQVVGDRKIARFAALLARHAGRHGDALRVGVLVDCRSNAEALCDALEREPGAPRVGAFVEVGSR